MATHLASAAPLDWKKTGRFCTAAFLMDFGGGVFFVARPYLGMRLGADSWQLGVIGLVWGVTYAVATPLGGFLSDRMNRKVIILCSALASAVVMLATGFVQTLPQLYLLQFLHALVFAAHWPAFFGWIGDAHHKHQLGAATGSFNVSWSLGGMMGAFAGGLLFEANARAPFLLAPVALVMAAGTMSTLRWRESHVPPEPAHAGRPVPKRMLASIFIGSFATFILVGLLTVVFPKFGKAELGIDAGLFGILNSAMGFARTAVFFAGIWFGRQLCKAWLALSSQLVMAAVAAGVVWFGSPGWVAFAMLAVGLSMGLNYYRGLYTSLEGSSGGGFKSGIHEGMLFAGHIVGSGGGGFLVRATGGLRAPYVPAGVLVAALVGVQTWLMRSARRRYGGWGGITESRPAPRPASGSAAPSAPSECRTPPDSPAE